MPRSLSVSCSIFKIAVANYLVIVDNFSCVSDGISPLFFFAQRFDILALMVY